MEKLQQLKDILYSSKNAVFFGGAGVSTESGIPDFRSAKGLYMQGGNISPEEILSSHFFYGHTKEFYEFYRTKMLYPSAMPNNTHKALALLEKQKIISAVITQNIDGLHQEAGSKNVIELHGSVKRNTCIKCGKKFDLQYVAESEGVPICDKCGGIIKPDVVLYEEPLDENVINNAISELQKADTLIIGGTSLVVYPAASFIRFFKGQNLIIINKMPTDRDKFATMVFRDNLGDIFGNFL